MKKTIAATALLATAAAGATVLVATPAHADVERRGTCAGATYELNVDRERGGYDVDADLEGAQGRQRVAASRSATTATSRRRPSPSRPTTRASSTSTPSARTPPARTPSSSP